MVIFHWFLVCLPGRVKTSLHSHMENPRLGNFRALPELSWWHAFVGLHLGLGDLPGAMVAPMATGHRWENVRNHGDGDGWGNQFRDSIEVADDTPETSWTMKKSELERELVTPYNSEKLKLPLIVPFTYFWWPSVSSFPQWERNSWSKLLVASQCEVLRATVRPSELLQPTLLEASFGLTQEIPINV